MRGEERPLMGEFSVFCESDEGIPDLRVGFIVTVELGLQVSFHGEVLGMHVPLGRSRGGVTQLDANLVDGVATGGAARCERVAQAVEGLTLDTEAAQDAPEVCAVRSPLVGICRDRGMYGVYPRTGSATDRTQQYIGLVEERQLDPAVTLVGPDDEPALLREAGPLKLGDVG